MEQRNIEYLKPTRVVAKASVELKKRLVDQEAISIHHSLTKPLLIEDRQSSKELIAIIVRLYKLAKMTTKKAKKVENWLQAIITNHNRSYEAGDSIDVDGDPDLYSLIPRYLRPRMQYMARHRFLITSAIIRAFETFNDYSDDEHLEENQTSDTNTSNNDESSN